MPARAAITALASGDTLRTWSLIVTIFGDLARAPGAEIEGPVLSALTRTIGVQPGAVRVALHRLRKDGWIASHRVGRVSRYFLTEAGRAQSERATARIFTRAPTHPECWHVVVAGPLDASARLALEARMAAADYIALAPGAWLAAGPVPDAPGGHGGPGGHGAGLFILEGRDPHLPAWLTESLVPAGLAEAYAAFDRTLDEVARLLPARLDALPPLERCALRVLVVHRWRRLVLRHPDLPDGVFPAGWAGAGVRMKVHALLDRLDQPKLDELAETLTA